MQRYTILCVDDEENILTALERTFLEEDYEILTANSGEEGLHLLEKQQVDLIISDQRMPGMNGVEFLKKSREHNPDTIRMVLSGFSDFDTITKAINEGEIYRLIQKPWDETELLNTVKDALEKLDLTRKNRQLQESLAKRNAALKRLNEQLEAKVKERTKELMLRNQVLLFSQAILDDISVPIIGVSSDETIAFVNKSAQALYGTNGIPLIGADVEESLPDTILKGIQGVLQSNIPQTIKDVIHNRHRFSIKCTPLSGQFAGNGVILETYLTTS